jgi:uncharacterized protein (DUF362 family)
MKIDPHKVYVVYGDRPKEMVLETLNRLKIAGTLSPEMTVGLKPNLVVAKPSHTGATTSPILVEGVIEFLKSCSISRIRIMESSGIGHCTKEAFAATGLTEIAKRYGVRLIDLKDGPSKPVRTSFDMRIFNAAEEVDYLINLPVVKAHCQTRITCALKNLKGLLPDSEKRRFHSRGLHEPIALLNTVIRPELIIADGMEGDLSFEEGGNPARMDRILIAKDPVLLDSYVASLLGYRREEIRHLVLSENLGVGQSISRAEQLVELNDSEAVPKVFLKSSRLEAFEKKIDAREACSICYGSLVRALERYRHIGSLDQFNKIHIGQGFRNRSAQGIGIGLCAAGFSATVGGCPPQAVDIVSFLEAYLGKRSG